ncbi:MAG: polysaccharide deacetylase family protein [Candidatus Sabulitectum sp.]|nr:polysaccharide deacetylase family protein [Candidatus Sabulitectum sp.]
MPSVKRILVSLHDVTPVMFDRSRQLTDMIMERAGTDFTMLVVPDFHLRGRIDRHPEFCSWLRELNTAGVEIAQHGLYHLGGQEKFSLEGKLFTKGEGEFLSLSRGDAGARIEEGYRIMSDVLGEPPSGFTAPAWLYSHGTIEALKGFSFRWIEYRWAVEYAGGVRHTIPAVVFATRTLWKRMCSVLWSSVGPAAFSGNSIFRLALHVRDLPSLAVPLGKALSRSTRDRTCITCADLAQE